VTADTDAFDAFFAAHEQRLRAFALRRTHSAARADELVAEVMTVAWQRFDEITPASALGWLCGITMKLERNERRGRVRRDRAMEQVAAEAEARQIVARLDTERVAIEERLALQAAWQGLDDDDRELLRLVAWDGLTTEEIGAAHDLSVANVRKRLSRARSRLRVGYGKATADRHWSVKR
jgi:RNA polymerase sigma-70 factor (ECF subfamily)